MFTTATRNFRVKVSDSRAADPGFHSCLHCGDFSRWSHTSDFKIGTPVATLSGTWRYRVSAGISWPGVSIPRLGEVESWICIPNQLSGKT